MAKACHIQTLDKFHTKKSVADREVRFTVANETKVDDIYSKSAKPNIEK